MIFLNDDGLGFPQSRRLGRIERIQTDKLGVSAGNVSFSAATNSTPNENMSQVENHIKQLERKRSFSKDHHLHEGRGRPRRHSSDPPAALAKQGFESDKDRFDDRVADFVRRMSLVEMEHNRNKSPEAHDAAVQVHAQVAEENESDEDASSLRVENDDGDNNLEVSERELLFSKPESPAHLRTKYFEHSSGDERGDTPSPSFIRKPSRQQEPSTVVSINDSIEQLTQNILSLNLAGAESPAVPLTEAVPAPEMSVAGKMLQSNGQSEAAQDEGSTAENPASSVKRTASTKQEQDVPLKLDTPMPTAENSNLIDPDTSLSETAICDSDIIIQDSDMEDNSLWFRTEALVSNSKSFNMVKRRMSNSKPTK